MGPDSLSGPIPLFTPPFTPPRCSCADGQSTGWMSRQGGQRWLCQVVNPHRHHFVGWGLNNGGELGIGNTIGQDLPQRVTTPAATGWASVTAGGAHTYAARRPVLHERASRTGR
jgi:Regulator of chromosome condensation (RCC1) repeat